MNLTIIFFIALGIVLLILIIKYIIWQAIDKKIHDIEWHIKDKAHKKAKEIHDKIKEEDYI